MKMPTRTFEVAGLDVKFNTAMIIGLAGETGTGKTTSAIRLGLGMAKVFGTRLAVVDTEALRALNYRKPRGPYDFDYIDFKPPFDPLSYELAIGAAVKSGCKVIVVDSMTHEHSGSGGVMDQIDAYLDDKCGEDYKKREKWMMIAHAKIKPQRKHLNNYIIQLARVGVVLILCYRANDKIKPMTAKERDMAEEGADKMKHVGFVPETTSPLRFEMTQAFLLMPGSKGRPIITPETNDEKIWSKTPMQFEGWIKDGYQLDQAFGEKLARWAIGEGGTGQAEAVTTQQPKSDPIPAVVGALILVDFLISHGQATEAELLAFFKGQKGTPTRAQLELVRGEAGKKMVERACQQIGEKYDLSAFDAPPADADAQGGLPL